MLKEEWRAVKGFEGIYEISNLGRLKSFKKYKNGYILSNKNSKGGYLSVILRDKDKKVCTRIHRLVAETFISNPKNYPVVNHIDGNKQNNKVENLEWCTIQHNVKHAIRHNPNMIKGIKKHVQYIKPKEVCQYSLEGDLMAIYPNAKLAQKITGVCSRNILQVARKEEYKPGMTRKQAGGYIWRFRDDKSVS
ncbi:hypothetical protein E5N06_07555 [Clostridium perfringens]|nr:hypothetical protein [Clostridium perfringens]ELC8463912.1 NUMOD4 motif-containing HNH endonuclease [Clostridium perfringens]